MGIGGYVWVGCYVLVHAGVLVDVWVHVWVLVGICVGVLVCVGTCVGTCVGMGVHVGICVGMGVQVAMFGYVWYNRQRQATYESYRKNHSKETLAIGFRPSVPCEKSCTTNKYK